MSDNLDTLLSELSSFSIPVSKPPVRENTAHDLDEEDIGGYIVKRTAELIDTSIGAIGDLKDYIIQGQNPDEIAALSELISSATKSLEVLNKINLQNKKAKTDKELKTMELESRKQIAGNLPAGNSVVNNTVNIVASREEIFKKLIAPDDDIEIVENIPVDTLSDNTEPTE